MIISAEVDTITGENKPIDGICTIKEGGFVEMGFLVSTPFLPLESLGERC